MMSRMEKMKRELDAYLLANSPVMNCCGKPRGQCTCHVANEEPLPPISGTLVFNNYGANCHSETGGDDLPLLLPSLEVLLRNEKTEGSNADDHHRPGLARAGRGGLEDQQEQGNYWDPAQRKARKQGAEVDEDEDEVDRTNRDRIYGEDDTGDYEPLPINPVSDPKGVQEDRSGGPRVRRAKRKGPASARPQGRDFRDTP